MRRDFSVGLMAVALAGCISSSNFSYAAEVFQTRLTPVAFDGAMRANVQGDGRATASLNSNTLIVNANFSGLPSPATKAHLYMGSGIGVPGSSILDLTVSPGEDGTVSGQVQLTPKQLSALRSGHVYLQINSQKAPDGNLWGWLLPAHPIPQQDAPQAGQGFLPQLDVPGNWTER